MSESERARWGGMALLVSGLLMAIGALLHPDEALEGAMSMPMWPTSHMLLVLAVILSIFGLTMLAARLSGAGWIGLAGYLLAIVGSMLYFGLLYVEAWLSPFLIELGPEGEQLLAMDGPVFTGSLGTVMMLAVLCFAVGFVLLGIAVWQDGGLPKWAGILLILGGLGMPFSPPLPFLIFQAGAVLLGAGEVWLGWSLWSSGDAAA